MKCGSRLGVFFFCQRFWHSKKDINPTHPGIPYCSNSPLYLIFFCLYFYEPYDGLKPILFFLQIGGCIDSINQKNNLCKEGEKPENKSFCDVRCGKGERYQHTLTKCPAHSMRMRSNTQVTQHNNARRRNQHHNSRKRYNQRELLPTLTSHSLKYTQKVI